MFVRSLVCLFVCVCVCVRVIWSAGGWFVWLVACLVGWLEGWMVWLVACFFVVAGWTLLFLRAVRCVGLLS